MFQTIVANKIGAVRQEVLQGKQYSVYPIRMIVPGVLVGNRGALYYPEDEISKSVDSWNGMPIVVNHPKEADEFISARSPKVLNWTGVGFVFNTKQDDGPLDAEAWIDMDKLESVNYSLAEKVRNGEPLEVSTGLKTANEPKKGTFNGKNYDFIARDYVPDHVALLSQDKGACSVKDGCGLSVNQAATELSTLVGLYNKQAPDVPFSQWLTANCGTNNECSCAGKETKCSDKGKEMEVFNASFVPTFSFQPTVNADDSDGQWVTVDGGAKLFIKDGKAHAGGPDGKVVGGGKKSKIPTRITQEWDGKQWKTVDPASKPKGPRETEEFDGKQWNLVSDKGQVRDVKVPGKSHMNSKEHKFANSKQAAAKVKSLGKELKSQGFEKYYDDKYGDGQKWSKGDEQVHLYQPPGANGKPSNVVLVSKTK
jgi:hypothetical protein